MINLAQKPTRLSRTSGRVIMFERTNYNAVRRGALSLNRSTDPAHSEKRHLGKPENHRRVLSMKCLPTPSQTMCCRFSPFTNPSTWAAPSAHGLLTLSAHLKQAASSCFHFRYPTGCIPMPIDCPFLPIARLYPWAAGEVEDCLFSSESTATEVEHSTRVNIFEISNSSRVKPFDNQIGC